jgi:Haemolysin-III related
MLENHESFIYIKNDEEVNLKSDRFNTEPLYKNSFVNYDLSDSNIVGANLEFSQKENDHQKRMNLNLDNDNNLLMNKVNQNNYEVYNRNSLMIQNNPNTFYLNNENMQSDRQLLKNSKIKKSYIEEEGPKIISLDQVPLFRKLFISVHPFILNGYRIHHTAKDCFFSIFKLHNETLNIWTHLIPCLAFLGLMLYLLICKR